MFELPAQEQGSYNVEVIPVIQFEFTNKDEVLAGLR